MTAEADRFPDPSPAMAEPVGLDTVFVADDLYALRASVAAHAGEFGLAEPGLGRLLVVATELATNAIRHGGGRGRLRLWRQDGAIYCEVSDDGPGIADTGSAGMQQVPLSTEGGRGLWVVRQFTDEVRFTRRDPGIVVTVKIQL
ncbi:ATP-binding protein [Catellatospora sichuanensis]|uniref:ATP-binding protein n=1 Tax=Catellatospora sichuanensis TaxID=1969805 RepID=UPI001182B548|nr:ATP-binding protein [Catellatospora sichuanensis]